ncbi:hypothetical protein A0J61_09670 [Choanephora cucurbitarum]|uniref:Uncharacterized protein n=1 Tax=Choanephora cucurbitarum TaxID=101091 RepID=A0A1C7N0X2_9FUNG|nr:hypothetical protein A0J61_09670 [Choanephora cucurbitarum]
MNQQTYSGAHPTTTNSITEQSTLGHMEQPARTGNHPTTTDSLYEQSSLSHMEQPARTGNHPTTTDSLYEQSSLSHMEQPAQTGNHPTTLNDVTQQSATQGSHTAHHQRTERPVADKDAFIQPNETKQHLQSNISPAERAKQLASEMDKTFEERRKSADEGDKLLKIGDKKEFKLE